MNATQKKVLGTGLFVAGLAALGYGGYELWLAWDHNSALAETDRAVGGLLSNVTKAIGSDLKMPYTEGAIIAGAGLIVSFLGWSILGKTK